MLRAARVVCLSGSNRANSFNETLMRIAGDKLKAKGASVDIVDTIKYNWPIFSEDIEKQGPPQGLLEAKELMNQSDAILVASPEYNGSMTPLLVNTISWLSRSGGNKDEPMYFSFKDKIGLVVSTSPGGLGGLRGVVHTKQLLSNLGVYVLPDTIAIGGAFKAFKDGKFTTETQEKALDEALERFHQEAIESANREHLCKIARKMFDYGELNLPNP